MKPCPRGQDLPDTMRMTAPKAQGTGSWEDKMKVKVKSLSRVRLFVTPWTVACQAPPPMRFSRQDYWSGLPFPSQGDLPNPGIELGSPMLQADSLPSEPPGVLFMYIFTFLYRLGFMMSKSKR